MGTWGYRIYENDTFCEVVDLFKERILEGMSAEKIASEIRQEHKNEVDECLVLLAVAESLWRLGKLSPDDLENVKHIVDTEVDYDYWMQLGADDEFLCNRRKVLEEYIERLSQPPTEKQKWSITKKEHVLQKGTCFWYRHRGNIYTAVVLEVKRSSINYYLIAISEKLISIPHSIANVLEVPVFTVAWFGDVDLLAPKRIHIIEEVSITRNFQNKYGIRIDAGRSVCITNCGQNQTWSHAFRQIKFDNATMQDFLN